MTATTLPFFAPTTPRAPRVGTARVDHWFKPAPQPLATQRAATTTADLGTARFEHWFRDHARAGQWSAQNAGAVTAPAEHGFEPAAPRLSGLRAGWQALRQRRALAKTQAELRALAMSDPRVLRDLQVAHDRAEWPLND